MLGKSFEARIFIPKEGPANLAAAAPAGLVRSMNRAGLLLAECALSLSRETLDLIRANASRTAMYCATEPSTLAHQEILQFLADGSPAAYSRSMPPKWGLQCSIGLAASATTILLGIEGGVHTFNHPLWSCRHALDQAALDLREGVVDFAVLSAVSSLEDPLMVQRWRNDYPQAELREGAAVIFLSRDGEPLPFWEECLPAGEFFGAAHPMISYLRKAGV